MIACVQSAAMPYVSMHYVRVSTALVEFRGLGGIPIAKSGLKPGRVTFYAGQPGLLKYLGLTRIQR